MIPCGLPPPPSSFASGGAVAASAAPYDSGPVRIAKRWLGFPIWKVSCAGAWTNSGTSVVLKSLNQAPARLLYARGWYQMNGGTRPETYPIKSDNFPGNTNPWLTITTTGDITLINSNQVAGSGDGFFTNYALEIFFTYLIRP